MKISIEWLKDYVEIPNLSSKEIGEKFTLATAEVEEVIETGVRSGEHFARLVTKLLEEI